MNKDFLDHISSRLDDVREAGLYKAERLISSPQSSTITIAADAEGIKQALDAFAAIGQQPGVIK